MSTVTKERLAEIKARYTAASDAPWSYDPEDGWIESDGKCGGGIAMMHPHGNINTVIKHNETFSKADAEFITHARTDVPDLVETLEWYIAVAEALGESQERLAKELREARAERDNLAHELKCSNETIDMLYQRSSNFAQQADTHEAEAKRLQDIVEVYDDRFATLYDEKNREIAALKKDLRDIKGAYEYFRKHAASILNNTADPEET